MLPSWTEVGAVLLVVLGSVIVWAFVLPKVVHGRSVPGPEPSWLLGNVLDFVRLGQQVPQVLLHFRRKYGRCYQIWFFHQRVAVLTDLDDVQFVLKELNAPKHVSLKRCVASAGGEGLLTVSAPHHAPRRRAIAKHMHAGFLQHLHEHIDLQARLLAEKLRQAADREQVLDWGKASLALTLDVICSAAFGRSAHAQADPHQVLPKAVAVIMFEAGRNAALYPFRNAFGWYRNTRLRAAYDTVHRFAAEALQARQRETEAARRARPRDLLDVFRDAEREGVSFDVISEMITFMLAGHETTALGMSWLLYEVAQRPEVERRIREEVDAVYGDRMDFLLPFEDIARLEYLTRAWKEALRLHPIKAAGTFRQLEQTVRLPGSAYVLTRGTGVLIPPYVLHREPQHWPEPEAFRPERFTREATARRHPLAYQAFSGGPRNCIGQPMAVHESLAVLAALYRHYRVELACAPGEVAEFHDLSLKPQVKADAERGILEESVLPVRLRARKQWSASQPRWQKEGVAC
ncbi:hypothetical protein CDCA_CDCA09G2801 [Cyanidium caldarium]|uniref:Cytochrome P450 n=1 Tax=Cyanidium caldarium TaxID=2771 RepID=A0AAV9IXC6_CYACA|nr:hypothetical protein CDCA_CDCA09G2801 [Cyanidium caldarium]